MPVAFTRARIGDRMINWCVLFGGLDGDAPARTVIEEQDQEIAERSGQRKAPIKSIKRA